MDMNILIIVTFLILVLTLLAGFPVPFGFGAALIFIVVVRDYDTGLLFATGFVNIHSVILLALPFFIVAGYLMETGGISKALLDLVDVLFGRIKGGLGVVVVVTCAILGAISGAASTAIAATGTTMIPRMKEEGYGLGYSTALVAASSVLCLLIPPSIPMIIYAWTTRTSVAACFLATVGPAMVLIVSLSLTNLWMVRKKPLKVAPRRNFKETVKDLGMKSRHAAWALLMPVLVLGGIYGGIITPTEASAIAVLYAALVGLFVYRGFNLRGMIATIKEPALISSVTILMLFMMLILVRILTMENIPQTVAIAITSVSDNKYVILAMINVFLLLVGLIMEDVSAIVLSASILMPVVQTLGVNPVHFAAILGVNLGMGLLTPPSAPLLYLACRVSGAKFEEVLKPILIFCVFGYLPVIILTTYIPELSLFLPRLFGFVQ